MATSGYYIWFSSTNRRNRKSHWGFQSKYCLIYNVFCITYYLRSWHRGTACASTSSTSTSSWVTILRCECCLALLSVGIRTDTKSYYHFGPRLMQRLSVRTRDTLARATKVKLRGRSQRNFCLLALRALCQCWLKWLKFYFGIIAEDLTNLAKHQIKNRCHVTQLLNTN